MRNSNENGVPVPHSPKQPGFRRERCIDVASGSHVIHALRQGDSAALRYGTFDAANGRLEAAWRVGGDAVPDDGLPWTLWANTLPIDVCRAMLERLPIL